MANERCGWCGTDPTYVAYHDTEWGRPETDSRALWEKLILEGFQAGLAWITILRKRAAFRAAFAAFEPMRVARFDERDIARLLADRGIVRSKAKIAAAIGNARAWERIEAREGFAPFLWQFYDGRPRQNAWARPGDVPSSTPESEAMSKALKAEGFTFCGPVIVYAFAQATGMVNDHLTGCPAHGACMASAAGVRVG